MRKAQDSKVSLIEERLENFASQIVEFVESNFFRILGKVELPSRASLRLKQLKEGRRRKRHRAPPEELGKKSRMVQQFRNLKSKRPLEERDSASGYEFDGDQVKDRVFPPPPYGAGGGDGGTIEAQSDVSSFLLSMFEDASPHPRELEPLRNGLDIPPYESPTKQAIERLSNVIPQDKVMGIRRVKRKHFPHINLENFENPIEVKMNQNARGAFETFLQAVEDADISESNVTPFLNWTGKTDLDDDELSDYMVEVMRRIGIGPKIGFSVLEALREEH